MPSRSIVRVGRVVLHIRRINRLLSPRRHEDLGRQMLVAHAPPIQAFCHSRVSLSRPAREGVVKLAVGEFCALPDSLAGLLPIPVYSETRCRCATLQGAHRDCAVRQDLIVRFPPGDATIKASIGSTPDTFLSLGEWQLSPLDPTVQQVTWIGRPAGQADIWVIDSFTSAQTNSAPAG